MSQKKQSQMNPTSLSGDHPAKHSQSRVNASDSKTTVDDSCSTSSESLENANPNTSFGKTSKESCLHPVEKILPPSSGKWSNSGMISSGEFSTHDGLVFPNPETVCTLSDVYMDSVPNQFYLNGKAIEGIRRRIVKRKITVNTTLDGMLSSPRLKPSGTDDQ